CHHYHVYSLDGWQMYQCMAKECHPAWRDYNFRHVTAGDDVDDVIVRTNPVLVEKRNGFVVLEYQKGGFTGITAVASDGRLVLACAWSCTWVRLFFDEMSEEQSMGFWGRSRDDLRWFSVPVYR